METNKAKDEENQIISERGVGIELAPNALGTSHSSR
jgi:hypothetical protein